MNENKLFVSTLTFQVEAAARKQAEIDFEGERRAMQEKMDAEVQELQTHLKYAETGDHDQD